MNELLHDIQIFQVSPCCVFSPEENKFLIPQKVVLIHGGQNNTIILILIGQLLEAQPQRFFFFF